jgi:hypothetical protein
MNTTASPMQSTEIDPDAVRPRPLSHRLLLPALFLLIACGVSAPFVVGELKRRQLSANENATLDLVKAYVQAQEKHRLEGGAKGEYARRFDQLSMPAAFPDMDDGNAPPLNGYRFRILTTSNDGEWLDAQGRLTGSFGLLAVPVKYMVTGRDTFLVSGAKVYCADFGIQTPTVTREMRSFSLPTAAHQLQ